MGSFGTRSVEIRHINKNLAVNIGDTDSHPADSQSSPSGKGKDVVTGDEQLGDTVPCEDTCLITDAFETQVVDFDDETQLVDNWEETEIMDIGGETQVMDDYDFIENMDTQLLDVSDDDETECESDGQGAERAKLFYDPVSSIDIQSPNRSGDHVTTDGDKTTSCHQEEDNGAKSESLPSDDVAQSSGSLRRSFTSIRTASLRAAGLAACKKSSKNADVGSCCTVSSVDCGGISNAKTVDEQDGVEKTNEKELCSENKSKVARSLARQLFMEEDVIEEGFNNDGREDTAQLPDCDNELAGLSYVNSQEPGELSQANALEFVDRFLKGNILDSDELVTPGNAVDEVGNPGSIAKGMQSLAQQATLKSTLKEASAYEWDDFHEDEGGGEFFIRKKEQLFGASCGPCRKPRSSTHNERRSQSLGQSRKEKEQEDVHDKITDFVHPNSKLVKRKKIKEIDMEKKSDNHRDHQLGLDYCGGDVGIDTQMAAEAMEALSTALLMNDGSITDQGQLNGRGRSNRKTTKNGTSKEISACKKTCLSRPGVVTRSKQTKGSAMNLGEASKNSTRLRTRSEHVKGDSDGDRVNPKVQRRRSNTKDTSAAKESELSDIGQVDIGGKERERILEVVLNNNGSLPVKTRSLRRKHRTSKNPNPREETPNLTSVTDNIKVDGSNCGGRGLQNTSNEIDKSGKKRSSSRSLEGDEVMLHSVARRTRSKRSTQCPELAQDSCRLSSKKHDACSSPGRRSLVHETLEKSPGEFQKLSSAPNITPVNLKRTRSAVSPICVGDEYFSPSCKKNLSLKKELYRLTSNELNYSSPSKDVRQRRDMSSVRVLFSQHLDEDIIKQQKKIVSRLGVSEASSILDATHFVADMFVRTRNMLEAIANAKPVVTPLWLESCRQASCFIDEKNYILRDTKKEKELGFSMPISLARASSHSLLEGRRVLITPNVKPGKEIISSLVKAVHGEAIERLCRSMSNNNKLLDNLLVLSCEEDFEVCVPLLEKGATVYSSELLLNGIITQKLEYERYRLFADHVKKTRSTLWLKDGDKFLPVAKTK